MKFDNEIVAIREASSRAESLAQEASKIAREANKQAQGASARFLWTMIVMIFCVGLSSSALYVALHAWFSISSK